MAGHEDGSGDRPAWLRVPIAELRGAVQEIDRKLKGIPAYGVEERSRLYERESEFEREIERRLGFGDPVEPTATNRQTVTDPATAQTRYEALANDHGRIAERLDSIQEEIRKLQGNASREGSPPREVSLCESCWADDCPVEAVLVRSCAIYEAPPHRTSGPPNAPSLPRPPTPALRPARAKLGRLRGRLARRRAHGA